MVPVLTWFINKKTVYDEAFLGSFESTDVFETNLTVVNNYLGMEPCDDIKNGKLMIMFKDYEDSALLQHLKVQFEGSYDGTLDIVGNRAYAKIPKVLSGDYGSSKDCTLQIKISIDQNLTVKSDLKQLILDIIY